MAKKKKGGARRPTPAQQRAKQAQTRRTASAASNAEPDAAVGTQSPSDSPAAGKAPRERKLTQAERIEAARRERQRKATLIRTAAIAVVVAILGTVIFIAVSNRRSAEGRETELEASGACEFDRKSDRLQPAPNNHIAPQGYAVNPPAGGDHSPSPSPAGDFSTGEPPDDVKVVHSLEHGYIALWYKPDLPAKELEEIKGVYSAFERDVLLIPRPNLPAKVAATAWNRRILCSRPDVATLRRFVELYRNEGPEKVPH